MGGYVERWLLIYNEEKADEILGVFGIEWQNFIYGETNLGDERDLKRDFKATGFEIWAIYSAGIGEFEARFEKIFSKLLVFILQSVSKKTSYSLVAIKPCVTWFLVPPPKKFRKFEFSKL